MEVVECVDDKRKKGRRGLGRRELGSKWLARRREKEVKKKRKGRIER